jgi:hypothetical protein
MGRLSMLAAVALCAAASAQNVSYVPSATPDISAGNTIHFSSSAYTYLVRIPASFMDLNQRKVHEIALMPAFTSTFTATNMLIGLGHVPSTLPCPFTFPSAGAATIGGFLDFTVIYDSASQGAFSWPATLNTWSPLGFAAAGGTAFQWNGVNDVALYFTYSGGAGGGAIRRAPTGPNTRTYAASYQAATSTACEALFAAVVCLTFRPGFQFTATTTGGGVGDLTLDPTDSLDAPGHAFGYTFISFATAGNVGAGPAFGLMPDANVFSILTLPPSVGNPLAYVVAPGIYPETNLVFPAGSLTFLTGVTTDFLQVGFDVNQTLLFYTNVSRVTF